MAGGSARGRKIAKACVIALGWVPLVAVVVAALNDSAGADPIETLTHVTGEWALRFLVLCLAVTPLRRTFSWPVLATYRRTFGLFAFLYASAHFSVWVVLDLGFDLAFVGEELAERPFITVGFATLVAMLPLAITSTRGWVKRLGRRWITLHRLVYVAGVGGVIHFWWLVKADVTEPLIYAVIVSGLLSYRVWQHYLSRRPATA